MIDSILSIVNPDINYSVILLVFLGYLVLLWIFISFWTLRDAKKRFKNKKYAYLFFLLVLPVNVPMFLFYIMSRPELEDDNVLYIKGGDFGSGKEGVNVPVINFVGENGLEMNLVLKINKAIGSNPDMKVNVDWASEKSEFRVENESEKVMTVEEVLETKKEPKQRWFSKAKQVGASFKGVGKKFKRGKRSDSYSENTENSVTETQENTNTEEVLVEENTQESKE